MSRLFSLQAFAVIAALLCYSCSTGHQITQQECDENKGVSMLVIPIPGDAYNVTPELEDNIRSYCFNVVNRFQAMEVLRQKGITVDFETMTQSQYIEVGKALGVDAIVYGTFNIRSGQYIPPRRTGRAVTDGANEMKARMDAADKLYVNVYSLRVSTGEVRIVYQNFFWRRL